MPTVYIQNDIADAVEKITIDLIVKYSRKFKEGEVLDVVCRYGLKNVTHDLIEKELSQKRD